MRSAPPPLPEDVKGWVSPWRQHKHNGRRGAALLEDGVIVQHRRRDVAVTQCRNDKVGDANHHAVDAQAAQQQQHLEAAQAGAVVAGQGGALGRLQLVVGAPRFAVAADVFSNTRERVPVTCGVRSPSIMFGRAASSLQMLPAQHADPMTQPLTSPKTRLLFHRPPYLPPVLSPTCCRLLACRQLSEPHEVLPALHWQPVVRLLARVGLQRQVALQEEVQELCV